MIRAIRRGGTRRTGHGGNDLVVRTRWGHVWGGQGGEGQGGE